jgi:hypothetical protein
MKKLLLPVLIVMFAFGAQAAQRARLSVAEARDFLGHLVAHVMILNSDQTLIKRAPAKDFDLLTHYPLPRDQVNEYKRNGHILSTTDELSDVVTYRIKDYALTNEKNETLRIQNDGGDSSLQDFALWTYDGVLSGQLGLSLKLDKRFERAEGHVTIVFEMPGNIAREVRVPVNLSISDKDPRPGS